MAQVTRCFEPARISGEHARDLRQAKAERAQRGDVSGARHFIWSVRAPAGGSAHRFQQAARSAQARAKPGEEMPPVPAAMMDSAARNGTDVGVPARASLPSET